MTRAVVCVATTAHYQRGMERLRAAVAAQQVIDDCMWAWTKELPSWPTHQAIPYGFKAHALAFAADEGSSLLLWADAAILPIRSLEPLWEKIEREGCWIHNGGWKNGQWCADSWYAECFPGVPLEEARAINKDIPHVVATTFGLNVRSKIGTSILEEYFRLASQTRAFCGPWWNSNGEREDYRRNHGAAPCGPSSTLGHRHDQSCLSIIAHRHGVKLTEGAEIFDYARRRPDGTLHLEDQDERTILLADGAMHSGLV